MNWGEIKQEALEKLEADDREPNGEYLSQMAQAANEALMLLAVSAGGPTLQANFKATAGELFDLKTLDENFYELEQLVARENGQTREIIDYSIIGQHGLICRKAGEYTAFYCALESRITDKTADSREILAEPQTAVLIPLYIASQIYKHDNAQLSVIMRNEFEAARQDLIAKVRQKLRGKIEFE